MQHSTTNFIHSSISCSRYHLYIIAPVVVLVSCCLCQLVSHASESSILRRYLDVSPEISKCEGVGVTVAHWPHSNLRGIVFIVVMCSLLLLLLHTVIPITETLTLNIIYILTFDIEDIINAIMICMHQKIVIFIIGNYSYHQTLQRAYMYCGVCNKICITSKN